MKLFKREKYLNKIRPFYHTDIIKVISGIRQSGKTSIMKLIIEELLSNGINQNKIIYLDLDRKPNKSIKTSTKLENYIDKFITDNNYYYLFIDEIQNVMDFEEIINAYNTEGNFSIFVTISNLYSLNGRLITKLTGRYLEFEIYTLSFKEYIDMKKQMNLVIESNLYKEFLKYLSCGGFPKSLNMESSNSYVEEVIKKIIKKDINKYNKIRNKETFILVLKYILNNFGTYLNINTIFNYFKNKHPIAKETIKRYIDILTSSKIIYSCPRFDIKTKTILPYLQKYYLSDLSLYLFSSSKEEINFEKVLENIIFLFLKQNDFKVYNSKIGELDCVFTTLKKFSEYCYFQVLKYISCEEVDDKIFRKIKDNYPKYIITLDPLTQSRYGIIHKNVIDFLLEDTFD